MFCRDLQPRFLDPPSPFLPYCLSPPPPQRCVVRFLLPPPAVPGMPGPGASGPGLWPLSLVLVSYHCCGLAAPSAALPLSPGPSPEVPPPSATAAPSEPGLLLSPSSEALSGPFTLPFHCILPGWLGCPLQPHVPSLHTHVTFPLFRATCPRTDLLGHSRKEGALLLGSPFVPARATAPGEDLVPNVC